MKRFTLFGNRLCFWLLLPWVLGGLFFFPCLACYELGAKEMFGVIVALVFFLWCAFILLAAFLPRRFGWLIYLVTASLSLLSVWYFYDSYFVRGESFSRNPDALHALELYGVHFLIFSVVGIRSAMKQSGNQDH